MAKIKYTKNELKRQKDALKRFRRFLPTLILKKQQLQIEIRKIEQEKRQKVQERDTLMEAIGRWIAVFAEEAGLEDMLRIEEVEMDSGNITGVEIPVLKRLLFKVRPYDLHTTPLWVDSGVEVMKKTVTLTRELEVLEKQIRLLSQELRITTQRVNLFEKVKIPEALENIRKIMIYLGDQQTAAVVCGKIAKKKLLRAES